MEIVWHGYSCFTIKTRTGTAVIDPFDPAATGLKLPELKANVVLVSHNHEGHNNAGAVKGEPKLIDWAGEYEVSGIAITAIRIPCGAEGTAKKPGEGLIYTIDADGIRICFMGDMGGVPEVALVESIGNVDILMIPVGGGNTMDAKLAHQVIEEIEPRAVIPMHFAVPGMTETLDGAEAFLKLVGAAGVEPKDKFSIESRGSLSEEAMLCILLKPQLG